MRTINPKMKYGNVLQTMLTQMGTSGYEKHKDERTLTCQKNTHKQGLLLGVLAGGQRVVVVSNTVLYLGPDLS